ncbi:MAG: hypothetical protein JWM95_3267 [Gemmatimonadetes bacterium]|nr:hypothetical protein [Gemmatimonadota bacterium]
MQVESIEIHTGKPDFAFQPLRRLEAKCEATHAFMPAPTMDTVNAKLREMAAGLGANAVIEVQYQSGMSMTSWKSMKATGLAVRRVSDDYPCPNCAEAIKRAAKQCRFCNMALTPPQAQVATPRAPSISRIVPSSSEPLRSNDNSAASAVMIAIVIAVALLTLIGILAS